jgi:hypothetical protein
MTQLKPTLGVRWVLLELGTALKNWSQLRGLSKEKNWVLGHALCAHAWAYLIIHTRSQVTKHTHTHTQTRAQKKRPQSCMPLECKDGLG